MSAVTKQEIVTALQGASFEIPVVAAERSEYLRRLADAIEQHGIAPPDIDANGCSTHPKARHGFARQASHSEGEYVCECAGFDPYDAGYQDGMWAAWDANGTLLPDGMVLVPKEPTQEMINAAIKNGAEVDGIVELYIVSDYKVMLAAAPKVSNEP